MGRLKKKYKLRTINGTYYYKLPSMKNYKTTSLKSETKAVAFVLDIIKKQDSIGPIISDIETKTFKQYAKYFFDYEKCPRVNRLRLEGRQLTKRYCDAARNDLVNFVFKNKFCQLPIKEIRKKELFALREDLLKKTTPGRVNDIITTISTVFSEAIYREELFYNPAKGIKKLEEKKKEIVTYTMVDYHKMFDINDDKKMIDIWGSYADFVFEFLECNTGMRNGEARCLKWKNVDLQNRLIYITEAFKDQCSKEVGLPKNNKKRVVGICEELATVLLKFKAQYTNNIEDTDYVFCYENKKPWTYSRNKKHHKKGLINADVVYRGSHVYRHTFNTNLRENDAVKDSDIRLNTGWADESIQDRYSHNEINAAKNIAQAQTMLWAV